MLGAGADGDTAGGDGENTNSESRGTLAQEFDHLPWYKRPSVR